MDSQLDSTAQLVQFSMILDKMILNDEGKKSNHDITSFRIEF
jgi:hypothetical protein